MARPGVLRRSIVKVAAGAALLPFGKGAWAATAERGPQRLIVILLRGAVDGLSVIVPYADPAYYQARPTIAIAPPGSRDGALALEPRFGLHPALASLMPLWRAGGLAFIHATGSRDPNRSHFEAQRYIENGTPGCSTTADGWMNRLLQALPGPHGPTEAISIGPTLPRILNGKAPVANLPLGPDAARPLAIDRSEFVAAFDRLYAVNDALGEAYREGRSARAELIGDLEREQRSPDAGAPSAAGFPGQAMQLARLIVGDARIRLAFVALGGWDTHVGQGGSSGLLANRLRPLGEGLAELARGLAPIWHDTVIVALSEFGRTVHENADHGTDHGHGNVIWVAGGAVWGGQIYGEWPGLTPEQLYQRRDLAITTDFRAALGVILRRHLRLADRQLDAVFPGAPAADTKLMQLFG